LSKINSLDINKLKCYLSTHKAENVFQTSFSVKFWNQPSYRNLSNPTMENIEQLQHKLERAQRDFSILYEISHAMRTTLELNHILYIILTGVTSHTGLGFNRAILFLANDTLTLLEPKMAIGPRSGEHAQEIWKHIAASNQQLEDLIEKDNLAQNTDPASLFKLVKDLRIPLEPNEHNVLSEAFYQDKAQHLFKEDIQKRSTDILFQTFKTDELVIVPLKIKDKAIGLIVADNIYTQRRPSEDDLRMFMVLANQAALAIENSRLYEMTRQKSHTDPITGLWNHGFFQHKLSSLIEESRQSKQPLSLIIIDIDNFKMFNDTFGHQKGDQILIEIAHLLNDTTREVDYVCRYGGEEFSIILPQTTKQAALMMAERIRQRIEEQTFKGDEKHQGLQLTVSIGVASLGDDGTTKEDLIDAADQAMYKAKRSGKNQTCIA